jgi:hypothetical protein
MGFDTLVHKIANQKGWTLLYLKDEDSYRLQVPTPGDRRQDVFITFRQDEEKQFVATMWSVISDVQDFNFTDPLELLRFNWNNVWGSLAVRAKDVVLVHNQLAAEADHAVVASAIESIAIASDGIEAAIYGDRDDN